MSLLTIWTIQLLELSIFVHHVLIDKVDEWRNRHGMPLRKREETLDDSQIWALANSMKLTNKERYSVSKISEKTALRNFPWISRRQAAKIVEMYRISRKNAEKLPV